MTTDECYADLIARCLAGERVETRNSVCFREVCVSYRFTRAPLVSLRKTAWRSCIREMQWFLSGSTRVADLHESVRPWWEPWADQYGCVRHNYAAQLRRAFGFNCRPFDQIANLIDGIRNHPHSRRNLVTTWNAADMAAPDCPITNCWGTVIQAFVRANGALDLVTYQRSADVVCGVPHNWLQMWAVLMWLAARTGRGVGSLTWVGADCHIYEAHHDLAKRIIGAANEDRAAPVPGLVYKPTSDEFTSGDFFLSGPYTPLITERAEMVV